MKANKIDNLRSLLEEKQRLSGLVKSQEVKLEDRKRFFQSNYKGILWENINPIKGETTIRQVAKVLLTDVLPAVVGAGALSSTGLLLSKGVRFALMKGGSALLKKIGSLKGKKANKEKDV